MNRTLRRLGPDIWLLVASVIAAAAIGRLFQGGLGGRAFRPLAVSAAIGSAVPALMALKRVPLPIRAVVGTVVVVFTSLWTTIGAATAFGLPTAHTWHVAQSDLRSARPLINDLAVPLHPAPGLVFLAAIACGVAAMLGSVLLHASDTRDHLYPGLALLSPFGLLAFACTQSTASVAVLVILFVVAGALTLITARADPVYKGHAATGRRRTWVTPTVVTACTIAGVVLAAVLVNSNAEGAGTSGTGFAPAVSLSAESLTSNLLAVEVHDANDVLFQANSTIRTYWQVAVLSLLRNGVWVPDPATQGAAQGSSNAAPVTQSNGAASMLRGQDFNAAVKIDDLSSRILPVPPGTIAISGTSASLTAVGAVSPTPTTSGEQYTTMSTPPVTEPGSLDGNAPVTTYPPALVQADTALPALPPDIEALARAVTAGAQGPLARAELLVNWFRSGQFHYTLDPPASPPGTDPLVSFLTQTRSGSCEQFAGAFVVLARSLGLPSRVVVGFTAGRYSGPGQVTVRGADAHAWPQVYLGPQAGWVSFEPTPQQPRGEVAPEGVVGPSGVSTTTPTTGVSSPTTASTTPLTVPTTVPIPRGSNNTLSSTPTPSPGGGPVWWTLISAAIVLGVGLVLLVIRNRRRWSPGGRTPDQLAILSQAEVDRALRRAGVERPLWQPMELFFEDLKPPDAVRADTEPATSSPASDWNASLIEDGVIVAHAVDSALFDSIATSSEKSAAAYRAALRLRRGLQGLGRR